MLNIKNRKLEALQIAVCPRCNGFGYEITPGGKHVVCSHCKQKGGVYGLLDEHILYWFKPISNANIFEEHLQTWVRNGLNFFLVIMGVLGLICFFFYIIFFSKSILGVDSLLATRHFLLLFFWCSVVADLFIYYRFDEEARRRKTIKPREYGADINILSDKLSWDLLNELAKKNKVNVADYFEPELMEKVEEAYLLVQRDNRHQVRPLDMVLKMLDDSSIKILLLRLGIFLPDFAKKIKHVWEKIPRETGWGLDFNSEVRQAFIYAYAEAYQDRLPNVTTGELLIGLIKVDDKLQDIFEDYKITLDQINNVAEWLQLERQLRRWSRRYRKLAHNKPKTSMNRAMTARPTKLLDSVSQDFTVKAKFGHFFPLVSREKEISEAFRILKEGRGNVMLVGDSGVGKTTILEGIAQLMTAEDVPPILQDKRLTVLDPGVFIAGAQGVGGIEERMVHIIYEIMLAGNIILAIEDIHNLLGAKSTGSGSDAGEILMNFLSQGYIRVIGTTTTPEYQKYIENKETFLRRFQIVRIPEMTQLDALKVLGSKAGMFEAKYQVFFSYEALEASVELTDRFIKDRHLPAKALDILEESAIYAKEKKGVNSFVNREDVAQVLSEKTNVKATTITESEAEKLLHIEEIMHQRIVGQDEAINAVAKALRRAREEIRDINRPIASLMFLGPTGVGKTETAKTIAEVYFGNEKNMIRLDMSEYQDKASIIKMIGDQTTAGYLTESIRMNPFSLILLDEIEKAHPDILNLFLQLLDDGRLTDGKGRTIDFTNSIIIATSNAATDTITAGQKQGLSHQDIYEGLMDGVLENYFRTEFINRFDRVVVFENLNHEEIIEITGRLLYKLALQLQDKGIIFKFTKEAVVELANKGYSMKFGARPIRRLLQDTVDDALAKLMLKQQINRRDEVILMPGGEIKIIKAEKL